MICRAVVALALLSGPVHAAPPADTGTRLLVDGARGPAKLTVQGVDLRRQTAREGVSIGVRSRYVTVPDALLDVWLLDHTSLDSYSVGIEVGIDGPAGSRVVFGLDYTGLKMPPGNWRQDGALPSGASYTEIDLHMIALDVTFLWKFELAPTVGFVYGVGLGLAYTPGTIYTTDVLPTCARPVAKCQHWRGVTRQRVELPSPVWPLLSLQAGFYWDPTPGFRIRFEGGFRGVLFAGVSTRYAF